mmetsp:Transcript_4319/g.6588  ORF Transcript_4319/g.6588 Transcript_4319/m.6588 type:complete len:111 (+) Transcript_4319:234-566(+)
MDHDMAVVSAKSNSLGTMAITSAMDGMIRYWDIETAFNTTSAKAGQTETWTLDVNAVDSLIATGTHYGAINVWDFKTLRKRISKHATSSCSLLCSILTAQQWPVAVPTDW